MVGALPDDAGNNRHARGRQFDGSTSPCAKDNAGMGRTVPGGIASRVRSSLVCSLTFPLRARCRWLAEKQRSSPTSPGGLLDNERNGARGFGGVENLRAVGFAVHPQPFGEANDDLFP